MQKIMFDSKLGLEQAVLEGRKTMTRRIISPKVWGKYREYEKGYNETQQHLIGGLMDCDEYLISLATFKVGEIVAVAQRYKDLGQINFENWQMDEPWFKAGFSNKMFVRADLMPHAIEITDIKVERLQDCSDDDILKEGVQFCANCSRYTILDCDEKHCFETAREAFAALIDKVSGKGTWQSNPWCFCYEFKLIK